MGVELDSSFHAKSRCRLKMSENTLLTRIIGLSQIKNSWFRASINIFRVIKSKRLRWVEHTALKRKWEIQTRF
jgi:hypothetical protein